MISDESIIQIAEKLGISATHIYEVFVAAQPTIALLNILCGIIVITFTIGGYILVKKYIGEDDLPPAIGSMIGGLVGVLISVWIYRTLVLIMLPEYSAIRELMVLII